MLAIPNSTTGCCPSGILQISFKHNKVRMFPKSASIRGLLRLFQKANILQTIMEAHEWRASQSVDRQISLLYGFKKKPAKPPKNSSPPIILMKILIIFPEVIVVMTSQIFRNFGSISLKSECPEFPSQIPTLMQSNPTPFFPFRACTMRDEEKQQWQVLICISRALICVFFVCIFFQTTTIVIFIIEKYYYFFIFFLLLMQRILDCGSTIMTAFFSRYPICEFHFVLTYFLLLFNKIIIFSLPHFFWHLQELELSKKVGF